MSIFDYTLATPLAFTLSLVVPYLVTGLYIAHKDTTGQWKQHDLRKKRTKRISGSTPNTPSTPTTATTTTTATTATDPTLEAVLPTAGMCTVSPPPSPPLNGVSCFRNALNAVNAVCDEVVIEYLPPPSRTWSMYTSHAYTQARDLLFLLPLAWTLFFMFVQREDELAQRWTWSTASLLTSTTTLEGGIRFTNMLSSSPSFGAAVSGFPFYGSSLSSSSTTTRMMLLCALEVFYMLFAFTLNQLWRYFVHRMLHLAPFYKGVHSVHHAPLEQVHALNVWHNSIYEFISMELIGLILPFYIAPVHALTYCAFLAFTAASSSIEHSGFHVNDIIDARNHWKHHTDLKFNYAETPLIDKIFGTFKE